MNIDPIDILSLPFHDETKFPDYGKVMLHRITNEVMVSYQFFGLNRCFQCEIDSSHKGICSNEYYRICHNLSRTLKKVTNDQ